MIRIKHCSRGHCTQHCTGLTVDKSLYRVHCTGLTAEITAPCALYWSRCRQSLYSVHCSRHCSAGLLISSGPSILDPTSKIEVQGTVLFIGALPTARHRISVLVLVGAFLFGCCGGRKGVCACTAQAEEWEQRP
jgi:hypothetical protein